MAESGRIQKRDAQGNWSAVGGGQVSFPIALAVDSAGNLYVGEISMDCGVRSCGVNRIQKRDVQGNWSVIATDGSGPGQVYQPSGLAVDTGGNLYVADDYYPGQGYAAGRIQQRNAQGAWSVIAAPGSAIGQVFYPSAVAVDAAGNLYVADYDNGSGNTRIQKRDAQGNWSVIATLGNGLGQVNFSSGGALAADTAGNLYVADSSRIQKRDAQGNWSVIGAIGQVDYIGGLAVDAVGDLYVADTDNDRVQEYTPDGGQ